MYTRDIIYFFCFLALCCRFNDSVYEFNDSRSHVYTHITCTCAFDMETSVSRRINCTRLLCTGVCITYIANLYYCIFMNEYKWRISSIDSCYCICSRI